ncbi:hydroxysqualene dehydroxylase HpnE [Thauera linaloolentis]|uniref:Squalene-associated FAD-dependent desaturase n=1 Tax=Thauera linaloolentis (strain DSM 12138 / JCM 21573 / CCUG 41526 / CIP 105981 / IAM 15112 / NBRC 102519 / 47Lol) TaxID=1123367 RepID=N6YFM9_THAL4|nr:hydroxysqualene dehydroxylase HpnE [Thauera linaloolentis]ENO90310.1 squalene-associated FAD-dependent desaturase [Thauera linaloolentis 47Lol = DSM 12138]MCM8566201.1 hydroxysqualene dehydroxylase HpnE [Thauera linaloolentis]
MGVPVVAVIGAGYAGLACAVELARAGVHVTVFERSHTLGGRARVVHKDHHWRVDNGQHILIGAYTELTRLLRATGCSPKQLAHLPLTLHVPGRLKLKAAALPTPFHLAVGLLRAEGLDWADRLAMLRLMRWLRKRDFRLPPDMTVTAMLRATRQTPALAELVWIPLCVAALNTPADEASAQVFAKVLRDSLAASASDSELLIPRVDLSELFPVPAARYLATRRGKLRTGNAIDSIQPVEGGFRLEGDPGTQPWPQVVVATAPYHASALLASTGHCDRLAAQIDALPHEPIVSVYLALGKGQKLPEPMIGLVGGNAANPAQWAFDRGQLGGPEGLVACVISASGPHEALARDELILAVHAQLERQLGRRLPAPEWSQVIVEKRATIACRPGIFRPGMRTPLHGLWLAGDYLDSPYPATLESAVRSGTACASAILADLGRGA